MKRVLKRGKTMLSVLLVLALIFNSFPMSALADTEVSGGEIQVSESSSGVSEELDTPDKGESGGNDVSANVLAGEPIVPIITDEDDIVVPFEEFAEPVETDMDNPFTAGDGTDSRPYQITTAEQLKILAELVNCGDANFNGKSYILINNIDLADYGETFNDGRGWIPIGSTRENGFTGHFDGNNKIVMGLYFNNYSWWNSTCAGLFGFIVGGMVENITVENASISAHDTVGGISAVVCNGGSVLNSSVSGAIKSQGQSIGGIAGVIESDGFVAFCSTSCDVTGYRHIGGIVGLSAGSVTQCSAAGYVSGTSSLGGIVGYGEPSCVISACLTTADVISVNNGNDNRYVGGVAGYYFGIITDCYSTGTVRAFNNCGGIVGVYGKIANCVALNPSVTGSRIVSHAFELSGNMALDTMLNDQGTSVWNDKGANRSDGADCTAEEALTASFWIDTMGWDTLIWNIENGRLPLLNTTTGPTPTLTMTLRDENGIRLTDGFTVNWYERGGSVIIAKGSTINLDVSDKEYDYEIVLAETLGSVYLQPDRLPLNLSGSDTVTVTLQKIPNVTLTGRVANTFGAPIPEALVNITQRPNGKFTLTQTILCGEDGSFTANLLKADTNVTVTATGYINKTLSQISAADISDVVDLASVVLQQITNKKITFTMTERFAALPGEIARERGVYTFEGLDFILFNVTQNRSIDSTTVQYPYILLGVEISSGDEIAITAVDNLGRMTAAPVRMTLDDDLNGDAVLQFVDNGYFTASGNGRAMIFDSEGNFVASRPFEDNISSNPLLEGSYTVVFIENTGFLTKVLTISKLDELGFINNTDYVLRSVSIENGKITDLGSIDVPPLNTEKLNNTREASFTVDKQTIVLGTGFAILRLEYMLKDELDSSDETICIEFQSGLDLLNGSVTLDGRTVPYTYDNGLLTVLVNRRSGLLRCCVAPTEAGEWFASASLSCNVNDTSIVQPLGQVTITATSMQINMPERTSGLLYVSGYASAFSTITLFANHAQLGETRANANGQWKLNEFLPSSVNNSIVRVYATAESTQGIVMSEEKTVLYDAELVEAAKITMINIAHPNGGDRECHTLVDFLDPLAQKPVFWYNPRYPTFTFVAEFTNPDMMVDDNVFVVTKSSNGTETKLHASYDPVKKIWIARGDYDAYSIPASVGVSYTYYNFDFLISEQEWLDIEKGWNDFDEDLSAAQAFMDEYHENLTSQGITFTEFGNTFSKYIEGYGKVFETTYLDYIPCSEQELYETGYSNIAVDDESPLFVKVSENTMCTIEMVNPIENLFVRFEIHPLFFSDTQEADQFFDDIISRSMEALNDVTVNTDKRDEYLSNLAYLYAGSSDNPSLFQAAVNDKELNDMLCQYGQGNKKLREISEQLLSDLRSFAFSGGAFINPTSPRKAANSLYRILKHTYKMAKTAGSSGSGTESPCDPSPLPQSSGNDSKPTSGIQDPSGFVYEAVSSNRLEGVKTTLYYRAMDEDGAGSLWDAEPFAQNNPLSTDIDGQYAWDVPIGMWQVKYEKTGYDTAYSEWLPVPPPQFDINIGLVSFASPAVNRVNAYQEGVELSFGKYMLPSTLTTDNVTVSIHDTPVSGQIILLNAEMNPETSETYASKIRFVPDVPFEVGDVIQIAVTRNALSYAGIGLANDFNDTETIKAEPRTIFVSDLSLLYNETGDLLVALAPQEAVAGKRLLINSNTPSLALAESEVTIDAQGNAVVPVTAILPGKAYFTLALDGTDLGSQATVNVVMDGSSVIETKAAKPTANLASGAVDKGALLEFSTATQGAIIYYTTDSSCPCDESEGTSRKIYTEPIAINEDVLIIAASYKDGLDYSDRLGLYLTVNQSLSTDKATLSSLAVNPGTLSPAFSPAVLEYSVSVPNNVNSIAISAAANDSNASVAGDGTKSINVGTNIISIIVTTASGETKTYTVTVNRETAYYQGGSSSSGSGGSGGNSYAVTVTFASNGGSMVNSQRISPDGKAIKPTTNPVRDGFSFAGWYADKELTDEYDFNQVVNSNMTIYAKWTENLISDTEVPMAAPTWQNPFSDVKDNDWYYGNVAYVVDKGILNGTSSTTFTPGEPMTRAMFVTALWRLAGSPVDSNNSQFTDIQSDAYYTQAVLWATANGIVNGVENRLFAPNAEVTREQMAAILDRYEQFSGQRILDTTTGHEFADANEISTYAKDPVNLLVKQGILSGKPGNLFDPKGNATRAEVAAVLHRFLMATQ